MKKLLLTTLLALSFLQYFAAATHAQTPPPPNPANNSAAHAEKSSSSYPLNTNPDVPQNFHTYTQTVFIEILASAVCIFSGVDILTEDGRCLGIDTQSRKIGYVNAGNSTGLLGVTGNLIAATYQMPASSGTYVQYVASNFGITQTSYAQFGTGIGFEGLKPVLEIWKVFRNLAYLAFVLLFVLIGLGIMLRLNIDARTIMTVQNQIPKIIIALALITLSYAIAGFLIDMMYLSIYVLVNLFASNNLATVNNMSNPVNAAGSFGGIHNIAGPAAESIVSVAVSIFDGSFGNNVAKIVSGVVGTLLGAKAGSGIAGMVGKLAGSFLPGGALTGAAVGIGVGVLTTAVSGAIGAAKGPSIIQFVAGIIVYLIIVVAVFSALIRTWFNLIKAYIFILLDVIFAPIFIMAGLLPGSPGGGFGSWIRSMLGNLAAFPTVLTLFLVGAAIQSKLEDGNEINNFIPPLVGTLSDDSARSIGALIGLGIILIMPESVNIAKGMFKSPERKLASAIMQPIGTSQNALNKFVATPLSKAWRKENDGTRGFLRASVEDTATAGLRRVGITKEKAKKIPVIGGIIKNRDRNMGIRARYHGYAPPEDGGGRSGNHSSSGGSSHNSGTEQNQPSEAQVKTEAEIRARREGIDPENLTTDEERQKMERILTQVKHDLGTPQSAPPGGSTSSSIAPPPQPGDGSGSGGASRRDVHEELLEHQGGGDSQNVSRPPAGDPTASSREAGERRAREDEENRRNGGNGNAGGAPTGGNPA